MRTWLLGDFLYHNESKSNYHQIAPNPHYIKIRRLLETIVETEILLRLLVFSWKSKFESYNICSQFCARHSGWSSTTHWKGEGGAILTTPLLWLQLVKRHLIAYRVLSQSQFVFVEKSGGLWGIKMPRVKFLTFLFVCSWRAVKVLSFFSRWL